MNELDVDAIAGLLDDVRRELAAATDELERSRAAHRRLESLLLGVLEHVPLPVVVIDNDLRVRATSSAADRSWGATLDAPITAVAPLEDAGIADVVRGALDIGHVDDGELPEGFGGGVVEEPGTAERYVVVWRGIGVG